MKNESYSSGEIREMLDMSRSALRYYIRKGLLDVEKNDENGYHTFDRNNLSDLRDISYLRQILDFSINDIQDCFNVASPDEYEAIFVKKKELLEIEIAQKRVQLERLYAWEKYISTLKNTPDSISIVEFEPFVFSPTVSPDINKLSLLCSSFNLEDGKPSFTGYGYCFDEPGKTDSRGIGVVYRFPKGKYLYSMCSSDYDMDDPRILDSTLEWVKASDYDVKGPIQVDYFFRIKDESMKYKFYYAITIPFSDCEIEICK